MRKLGALFWLQGFILLCSLLVVFAFLKFYLSASSKNFLVDFERQNFFELGRGETFVLSRKLASLSAAEQFVCVVAKKGEVIFFEKKQGSCQSGIFQKSGFIANHDNNIHIQFVVQLPRELFWGFVLFLLAQGLLAVLVVLSQRSSVLLRHRHELELAGLAKQVAHDIQSPLAVLRMLAKDVSSVDQSFLPRSVDRLHQIVGHLLKDAEKNFSGFESIGALIESVVQEKLLEVSDKAKIEIDVVWVTQIKDSVLRGDPYLWRRIFSNLLNNSIEAVKNCKIQISCDAFGETIHIGIHDNGPGIPAHLLTKIGQRGVTGKTNGQGLGLFSAKKFVESLGGSFKISNLAGARVDIFSPRESQSLAVLVEDDQILAKLWHKAAAKRGIVLRHFSTPEEFMRARSEIPHNADLYFDVEFAQSSADIVEMTRTLSQQGYQVHLATGHWEKFKNIAWLKSVSGKEPPWI